MEEPKWIPPGLATSHPRPAACARRRARPPQEPWLRRVPRPIIFVRGWAGVLCWAFACIQSRGVLDSLCGAVQLESCCGSSISATKGDSSHIPELPSLCQSYISMEPRLTREDMWRLEVRLLGGYYALFLTFLGAHHPFSLGCC